MSTQDVNRALDALEEVSTQDRMVIAHAAVIQDAVELLRAEWQASRKPEAAPPVKAFDTSREPVKNGAVSLHVEAAPSDTDDRETLAGVIQDAGEYVPGSHAADYVNPYLAADKILAAGFSRTPHPVQVEVTDEMRERLANEVGYPSQADDYYGPEGDEYARGRANGYNAAFENVLAALGGGDRG